MNSNDSMDNKTVCEDLNLQISCELISRVRLYASANKTTLTTVVIEALDAFLRENKN